MITVRNLHKRFGSTPVFERVSFDVERGETLVVFGPSGSGKTTLLRCLVGLESFDSGSIGIDGVTVDPRTPKHERAGCFLRIRQACGFVFQQYLLFPHLSVLENLMLGPIHAKRMDRDEARRLSLDLLRQVGLADKADARPHRLSGGEQQRVAIARAQAMQPSYILYDEPTSSLDGQRAREIWGIMRRLSQTGQTQVVVTHQEELTRAMPCRVVRMNDGRLEAAGPLSEEPAAQDPFRE
jgi:ABC-type polar amino acid transport system ATPase subunit